MNIETKELGKFIFIKYPVADELELLTFSEDYVQKSLERGFKVIVLDFDDVIRFYSTTIKIIVKILNNIEDNGGELFLINVSERIKNILADTNIIQKLNIYDSAYDIILAYNLEDSNGNVLEQFKEKEAVVKRETEGTIHTVYVSGHVMNISGASKIVEEVEKAIEESATEIIMNLQGTLYIDSLGISRFTTIYKKCQSNNVSVRAINLEGMVADAFYVTKLSDLFKVESSK